jgi:hypothetical protein
LGLILTSQAAWADLTISPSPSTDGSYTITWSPAGCTIYYVYGFPTQYCYELHETVGGQYGSLTDSWTSGGYVNISGHASGTYTYTIWAYWSGYLGNGYAAQQTADQSVCTTHTVPRYAGWVDSYYDYPYDTTSCSFYSDGPIQYPEQYDDPPGTYCRAISPLPQVGTMQICN